MGGVEEFCGSRLWDLNITWYTNEPDFTECFKKTVLPWTPCIFLWLFAPLDIYYAYQNKIKDMPRCKIYITRFVLTIFLLSLSLIEECSYLFSHGNLYPVDATTPIIRIATFLLVIFSSELCRRNGYTQSGAHFIFWLLMLIFGLAEFLSKLKRQLKHGEETYDFINCMIYYLLVLAMFVLHCFYSSRVEKYSHPKNVCPEVNASLMSRITYTWFDKLAWLGYKRPLVDSDIWELQYEDSSPSIIPIFEKHWNKELQKITRVSEVVARSELNGNMDTTMISFRKPKNTKPVSIIIPLTKSFGGKFALGQFMKLVTDILTFVSPQILSLLMKYTDNREEPLWKGILYASLLFGANMMQTIFVSRFFHEITIVEFRVRTSLTSAIFKKALRISNAARKEFTLGEIVNLMSVDVEKIMNFLQYVRLLWSGPLVVTMALIFLWKYLGVSVLAGLAVILMLVPINIYLGSKNKALQIMQMNNKDKRVKLTNEILNGMKVLKLYAWETGFQNELQKMRERELTILKKQAYLISTVTFLFACAEFLISFVSFAAFVLSSETHVLDAETVFVSISLFNILRVPLTQLPNTILHMIQAIVSVKRINKFLNSDELIPNSVTHDTNERYQLLIENSTFTWGEYTEEPILRDINLRVDKGGLIAVVGTVGAGKSSLISAFLGEMTKVHGKVNTKGSIAYVPQQAWIQNATLRNNITFGNQIDEKLYDSVIRSCALKPDLDVLPAGDETEIGEKGINLSGGQKQRVSLARAVFSDADNYFLDDPLSAVDAHVGKHIFERVIGPNGLLKGKTRILVTHSVTYLPEVDKVVVLKDGVISETGTYEELLAKEGAFAEFLHNHVQENVADSEEGAFNVQLENFDESMEPKRNSRCSSVNSSTSLRRSTTVINKSETPMIGQKIIESEKVETGNVGRKVYFHYFSSIEIYLTSSTLLFSILYHSLYIGINAWLAMWANDQSAVVDGAQDLSKRNSYLGICSLFLIGLGASCFLFDLSLRTGCWKACKHLHNLMLVKIMRVPMNFMEVTPIGRILVRFSKDVDVLDNNLPAILSDGVYCLFVVLSTIIVISYSTPAFLIVILPIGGLYYFIQKIFVATSRQLKRLESASKSPVYSHFGETIQGVQSVRAYALQGRFIKENEKKVDTNQKFSYPTYIANRWAAIRLETVGNLVIFFAALFAVLGRDLLSAGVVGLSVSFAMQISRALNWFVRMTSSLETNIVAVERVKEYGELSEEAEWELPDCKVPANWPYKGMISFENLQIRYREGLDLVLKGLTFTVNGGEKVGIVGRTGAGKSSLTLSLFRIIEPAGGRIVIDGVDITSIGLHTLRSKLTIIPQDPVLFSGSLRINMDPLNEHSDESIWSALKMAGLISHISSLERGLQYEVSEGGDNFSVGQRQLICLARALLRKTKILILDEATAAVDLETDDLIQRTIRSEFKDCTVLTIAHRLNTIMDSDRVIVLDNGVMVEYDSPEELLKKRHSYFYKMAQDSGLV